MSDTFWACWIGHSRKFTSRQTWLTFSQLEKGADASTYLPWPPCYCGSGIRFRHAVPVLIILNTGPCFQLPPPVWSNSIRDAGQQDTCTLDFFLLAKTPDTNEAESGQFQSSDSVGWHWELFSATAIGWQYFWNLAVLMSLVPQWGLGLACCEWLFAFLTSHCGGLWVLLPWETLLVCILCFSLEGSGIPRSCFWPFPTQTRVSPWRSLRII